MPSIDQFWGQIWSFCSLGDPPPWAVPAATRGCCSSQKERLTPQAFDSPFFVQFASLVTFTCCLFSCHFCSSDARTSFPDVLAYGFLSFWDYNSILCGIFVFRPPAFLLIAHFCLFPCCHWPSEYFSMFLYIDALQDQKPQASTLPHSSDNPLMCPCCPAWGEGAPVKWIWKPPINDHQQQRRAKSGMQQCHGDFQGRKKGVLRAPI